MSFDISKVSVYDEVAYPSYPYPLSHPAHLASVARLVGLFSPPVTRSRILELGCGAGGNLLPIAETFPESQCVGLDVSSPQIAMGRETAECLGLPNVTFEEKNVLDVDARLGKFDYIICHGVYSWTTEEVRDRILTICGDHLSPQGVAYVNYNTHPGWHLLGMLRDILRFQAGTSEDPEERVGRAKSLLTFLAQTTANDNSLYGSYLRSGLNHVGTYSDSFLFHAMLNVVNSPCYLHEFVRRAEAKNLQHVGDADTTAMWFRQLPPAAEEALHHVAPDALQRDQILDFLFETTSRRSLLCHQDVTLDRRWPPASLDGFHLSARLHPDPPGVTASPATTFRGAGDRTVTTAQPLTLAALLALAEAWPESIPFDLLTAQVQQSVVDLGSSATEGHDWQTDLLRCYVAGMVELSVLAPRCTKEIGERPRATRLARYQAATTDFVADLRHNVVRLDDYDRRVLALLDGTRSISELAQSIREQATTEPPLTRHGEHDDQAAIHQSLLRLVDRSLLLQPE